MPKYSFYGIYQQDETQPPNTDNLEIENNIAPVRSIQNFIPVSQKSKRNKSGAVAPTPPISYVQANFNILPKALKQYFNEKSSLLKIKPCPICNSKKYYRLGFEKYLQYRQGLYCLEGGLIFYKDPQWARQKRMRVYNRTDGSYKAQCCMECGTMYLSQNSIPLP